MFNDYPNTVARMKTLSPFINNKNPLHDEKRRLILWWETGLLSKITKFFAIWQQWTVNWNPDFLPLKEWMSCIFRKANEREQGEAAWCWLPAFFRQPLLHLRSVPVPLKVVDLPLKKNREPCWLGQNIPILFSVLWIRIQIWIRIQQLQGSLSMFRFRIRHSETQLTKHFLRWHYFLMRNR